MSSPPSPSPPTPTTPSVSSSFPSSTSSSGGASTGAIPATPEDRQRIVTSLVASVLLKDRRYHLVKYSQTFYGHHLCKTMIETGVARDIPHALAIGQELMRHGDFHHIGKKEKEFKNEKVMYRFAIHEKGTLKPSSASAPSSPDPSRSTATTTSTSSTTSVPTPSTASVAATPAEVLAMQKRIEALPPGDQLPAFQVAYKAAKGILFICAVSLVLSSHLREFYFS
jgi:hypothetical protein